jgi:retinol dehydrogenase-12
MLGLMLYPAVNGAYTELYAGLSPDVKGEEGKWVVPFGRIMDLRSDFVVGGHGKEFWEWTEGQVEKFA